MPRPVTVTKERILSTAIDLLRSGGPSALTARGLCTRLGCGASAIFSSFGSIQGVREATREEARKLYRKRRRSQLPTKTISIPILASRRRASLQ